jgi:NADP-dependent 3-hydroxy acid dehydrogenase YdfG
MPKIDCAVNLLDLALKKTAEKGINIMSSFDLAGETAVITGGASGIGLAAARVLSLAGARIVLTDYKETNLEKSHTDLEQEGIKSYAVQLDVTDVAQVEAGSMKIEKDVGPVSILLNSAGIAMLYIAIEIGPKDWLRVINVSLNGTFWPPRVFGLV